MPRRCACWVPLLRRGPEQSPLAIARSQLVICSLCKRCLLTRASSLHHPGGNTINNSSRTDLVYPQIAAGLLSHGKMGGSSAQKLCTGDGVAWKTRGS